MLAYKQLLQKNRYVITSQFMGLICSPMLAMFRTSQVIQMNELLLHLSKANQTDWISCEVLNMAGRGLQMRPMNMSVGWPVETLLNQIFSFVHSYCTLALWALGSIVCTCFSQSICKVNKLKFSFLCTRRLQFTWQSQLTLPFLIACQ